MIKWTEKLATELVKGDTIIVQGTYFVVDRVVYDPYGNTGHTPRYCVITDKGWDFGANVDKKWFVLEKD